MAVARETHTPVRSIRVPHDVWDAAQKRAASDGTTVSAVVVTALSRYGAGATANVTPPPQNR